MFRQEAQAANTLEDPRIQRLSRKAQLPNGDDLQAALASRFPAIGALRVWLRFAPEGAGLAATKNSRPDR